MNNTALLTDLRERTRQILEHARQLKQLPVESLNHRPHAGPWSALECLEHLNRYCAFYWSHLEAARMIGGSNDYSPGWLGSYFVRLVAPQNTKKQKTLRHMDPSASSVSPEVIDTFLRYQEQLLGMLDRMERTALGHRAVPVEFMRFIRLKTGDMLQFLVTHEERHLRQAQRAADLSGGSHILVA